MNKYRDALYRLDDGEHTIEDFELLKKLAKEKDEQDSRKDKLIVGSQWECVADCYSEFWGDCLKVEKGTVVTLQSFHGFTLSFNRGIMPTDQFLICFKPKEYR